MDDLAAQLATSFQVTNAPNTTAAPHPRFSDYKARTTGLADQEKRRKAILDIQKKKRFDAQSHVRRLAENVWDDLSEEEAETDVAMDVETKPKQHRHPGRNYKNQLMLSEWMIEVPEDFEEEWVMVLCPVGKRNLVVASYGQTTSYSKGGWTIDTFLSRLPGGSKSMPKWQQETTVLDCVYNEITKTFYVLDMMNWKNYPLYDTETEFRFYWMQDKLSEYSEIGQITKKNKFRFEVLPNFRCSAENIKNVLSSDLKVDMDGLLFYHKRTHYTFGSTPLVTWLKAYMVPEILQIEVPSKYTALKPLSYTNFENHVEQVKIDKIKEEEKKLKQEEKWAKKNRKDQQTMDTDHLLEKAAELTGLKDETSSKTERKMDSEDGGKT